MNYKLKYNSKEHNKIREALRNRIKRGARAISQKTVDYAHDEERMRAYIKHSTVDELRKKEREQEGKPRYTTIEVPYSYAIVMSLHTYLCSVFLSRTPILQFQGRHGQTEQQIQGVEAIMDYQTHVGEHMVPYFIWLLDKSKYGVGIVGGYWAEEFTRVSAIVERPRSYLGMPVAGEFDKVREIRDVLSYAGNRLFNVRPQDFLFDSNVSLARFQHGEFCGRFTDISWNDMVIGADSGQYYNLSAIKTWHKTRGTSTGKLTSFNARDRDAGSPQLQLPEPLNSSGLDYQEDDILKIPGPSEAVELEIRLIPKEWGLGNSDLPEIWVFTLAFDEVIIESHPKENLHGKFEYAITEYEIEGYALNKRSLLEILDPLQNAMTWLLNTHFYNVRDILNGQFIYDPLKISAKDFKSDGGGRLIKLLPGAMGTKPSEAIHQIQTIDVTANHVKDMNIMAELMQRVSGVADNIMGVVNSGGRKSATEVRNSNTFSANRLKVLAEYNSALGFSPLATMMLQNTQQFYDGEQMFKIAGDLMIEGQKFAHVTPDLIAGFYDFVPVDGTQPIDRFAQVTMWTQLLAQLRNMPEIAQTYDIARIFGWVAQLGGIKNINRFKVNVIPDEEIPKLLQRGDVIPIGGSGGDRYANTGERGKQLNTAGVPGAAQVPGVGTAG